MNLKSMEQCERSRIERWSRFQLSYNWKRIGLVFTITIFIALIVLKFIEGEPEWIRGFLKRGLLVSLLIISLSKEKFEDEMITSLRAKSYTLAFIIGVLYTLVQPGVDYLVHHYVFESSATNTFSYFQLLFFMLFIQIMFFEVLKRNR